MKKIISIILAVVTLCCMTALVACNNHEHEYDHACDPKCNTCGETREIEFEEMKFYTNTTVSSTISYYYSDIVSGQKTQHVFKVTYDNGEVILGTAENDDYRSTWDGADYKVRIFDANFNELTIKFEADDDRVYATIVDAEGKEIAEYDGKTVYYMVTLNKTGEDFRLII